MTQNCNRTVVVDEPSVTLPSRWLLSALPESDSHTTMLTALLNRTLVGLRMASITLAIAAILLTSGPTVAGANVEDDNDDPNMAKVVKKVMPTFPPWLSWKGVQEGWSVVVFMVAEDGELYDFVVLAATHPLFGKASIEALRQWEILPAKFEGKPRPTRVVTKFKFRSGGNRVVKVGVVEHVLLKGFDEYDYFYSVSEIAELDQEPVPIRTVAPEYPANMKFAETAGQVLVEFYIDPEGKVRAPGIKSATTDHFAMAALDAIKDWKFKPPEKKRKAVYVRAFQPFIFEHTFTDEDPSYEATTGNVEPAVTGQEQRVQP